jgi:HEAT repeat protein
MALSRRSRVLLAVLVLAGAAIAIVSWQWYPIRVRMILSGDPSDAEVAKALRELGKDGIPAMIGVYESGSGEWDDKVLLGGILAREPYRRITVLERGLSSDSAMVRRVSAWLLVETRNADRASEILTVAREWADDRAWGRRANLVILLTGLGEVGGTELLVRILDGAEDEDEQSRVLAARVLRGAAGDPTLRTEALLRALKGDPSDVVRVRALQSLTAMGWRGDLEPAKELAASKDYTVRQIVANALGMLRDAAAEPILGTLLEDEKAVVRRSALGGLGAIGSPLVDRNAERLREDSYMGVRGDLSLQIQNLGLESRIPVLVQGLLETEPDPQYHIIRKTIQALHKLTGKHHGFPDDYFTRPSHALPREQEVGRGWFDKPRSEKLEILQKWWDEYGTYDRRPALLWQLRHADPKNVARAVRELHLLRPEAPTPGFTKELAEGAGKDPHVDRGPFLDLKDEAIAFQLLPEEEREKYLKDWERVHR